MLRALSGRRHRVITGLAFYTKAEDRLLTGYDLTYVTFRELSDGDDRGLPRPGDLPRQGRRLRRPGDRRRLRRPDEGRLRQRRRLSGGEGPPAPAPASSRRRSPSRSKTSISRRATGRPRPAAASSSSRARVTGETVRVQIVGERGAARIAEVVRVESPSPRRAEPRCPHFGPCGGCLFQHVDYGTQLELKERHLRTDPRGSRASGRGGRAVKPITASPDLYGFRNKMEFAFGEKFGRARPRAQGKSHDEPPDLPPDAADRRMPDLRSVRRAHLPGLPRFRPRERPRGLRAGHPEGPPPPSRPPGREAHGRAHGPPRDGRAAGARSRPAGRAAGRRRARAPELRPRHQRPRLRPRRVREDAARRRRPVHRGEAGPARLPDLSPELLPDEHGRRGASLPNGSGKKRLSRRRAASWGSTAAAGAIELSLAAAAGRVTGIDSSAGQYRQRRGERPGQPDRERRLRAGDGRSPARRAAPRAGRRRHRRPAARRPDGQGPAPDRSPSARRPSSMCPATPARSAGTSADSSTRATRSRPCPPSTSSPTRRTSRRWPFSRNEGCPRMGTVPHDPA